MFIILKIVIVVMNIHDLIDCSSSGSSKPVAQVPQSPTTSTKFPRGTSSRRTFHGGIVHDRRTSDATNGADTTSPFVNQPGRMSFLNKLTSKFSRRYHFVFMLGL